MDKISLSEYWEMLNRHDWYHAFSDDGRVDRMGAANYAKLAKISEQSEEHKSLLSGFGRHYFTGKPWITEQIPKPEKPLDAPSQSA